MALTHRYVALRRTALGLIAIAGGLSLASAPAWAQQGAFPVRTPVDLRQQLAQAAQRAGIQQYLRTMPNGVQRCYLNPSGSNQISAMEQVLPRNCASLEICHIGSPTANHTMGIFNRQLVHVQYRSGTGNWRLRNWGGNVIRPSANKLYSAVIQLTDAESSRLQAELDKGWQKQGTEAAAGRNWEIGNLAGAYNRGFNCVSYWTEMPIGDGGQPLWKVLGLSHSYSGNPPGIMRALETEANQRVAGICVYGPRVPNFNADSANVNRFDFAN